MAISAFKTCKVWFSLNPSMCNSGFYRIPGSNVCFSLSIFSSPQIFLIVFLINFFFLVFLSFFAAFSSQPIPSFYNGVFGLPGEPLVLLFCPFANRARPIPIISVSPVFVFFILSFFQLWFFWKFLVGHLLWDVLRYALLGIAVFWQFLLFPFLSHLGGILFCQLESRLLSFFFFVLPCFGSPRFFFSICATRGRWVLLALVFFCFLFLIFFFCLFLSSYPSLPLPLCLKGSAPLDGCWGSWLFIPCRGFLIFFFFWMLLRLGLKSLEPFYSFMVLLHLLLWT